MWHLFPRRKILRLYFFTPTKSLIINFEERQMSNF